MLKFFFVAAFFVFCAISASENGTNFAWDELDEFDEYLGVPPSLLSVLPEHLSVDDYGNVYSDDVFEQSQILEFYPIGKVPSSAKYVYDAAKIEKAWKKSWETKYPDFEMRFDGEVPQLRCKTCAEFSDSKNSGIAVWTDINLNNPSRQFQRHLGRTNEGNTHGYQHTCSLANYHADQIRQAQLLQNDERMSAVLDEMNMQQIRAHTSMEEQAETLLRIMEFVIENDFAISSFNDLREHLAQMITYFNSNHGSHGVLSNLLDLVDEYKQMIRELATKYKISGKDLDEFVEEATTIFLKLKEKIFNSFQSVLRDIPISSDEVPTRATNSFEHNRLVEVLGNSVFTDIVTRLRNAECFTLLIDESTDVSHTEQLSLYASWVENGESVSYLIGLIAIHGSPDAENIFTQIMKHFENINVDINKMTGFGSDGASVMTGADTGVAVRLRNEIGAHLITIHCVSHCVALSAKTGIETSTLSSLAEDILSKISYDFANSPKRDDELAKIANTFAGQEILKILKYHKVRWLSRTQCVGRLIQMMKPLLAFYQADSKFKVRYHQLANYGVQRFFHFLYDVLLQLQKLTKITQEKVSNLKKIRTKYLKCVETLKSLLNNIGRHEQNFLDTIKSGLGSTFTLYGHGLSSTFSESDVLEARTLFLNPIIQDLENRFDTLTESTDTFSLFLDLEDLEVDNVFNEIQTLATSYNMVPSHLVAEFNSLIYEIETSQMETSEAIMKFLEKNKGHFPLLHFLYQIYMTLPTSTAEVERGFSLMNRIKTPERNKLGPILVHCMFISLYGASFAWNWKKMARHVASKIWKYKK